MPPKNDKKPLCPIPRDAKRGDIIVFRCGVRREYCHRCASKDGSAWTKTDSRGRRTNVAPDGSNMCGISSHDCVAFIRATPKKPGKVKVDRDAKYILDLRIDASVSVVPEIIKHNKRLKAIATRLQSLSRKGEE